MPASYCNPEEVLRSARGCLDCPDHVCMQACPEGVDLLAAMRLLVDWARQAQRRDPDAYVKEAINAWYAH
jgi:NADPH-dependent glutamate synthase beta subunit-like oxidoreductase